MSAKIFLSIKYLRIIEQKFFKPKKLLELIKIFSTHKIFFIFVYFNTKIYRIKF